MHDLKIDESGTSRKLNWRPDTPDFRDFKYSTNLMAAKDYPVHKDIVEDKVIPFVVNQYSIGSCTGNGWRSMAGCLQLKELQDIANKNPVDTNQPEIFGSSYVDPARLYIYFNERILEGTVNQDAGAMIRTGFRAIARWGICPEAKWAYTNSNVFRTPTTEAYKIGSQHKLITGFRLNNSILNELKDCLASGFPIVFGMSVYESFMSRTVAQTGIVPMPKRGESLDGGHCMLIVGYDDVTKLFKVQNSWGTSWGKEGFCHIPYAYLTNMSLASDFWTARRSQDGVSNLINHQTI